MFRVMDIDREISELGNRFSVAKKTLESHTTDHVGNNKTDKVEFESIMQRLFILGKKKKAADEVNILRDKLKEFALEMLRGRCIEFDNKFVNMSISKDKCIDFLVEHCGNISLYDVIFAWQRKYEEQFGPHMALFVQVGDFYENYGVDNDSEKIGASFAIGRLLNAVVTVKSHAASGAKKKVKQDSDEKDLTKNSRSNPLMIGTQIYRIDKWISILNEAGWKVILYKQQSLPDGGKKSDSEKVERVFEGIYMSSTDFKSATNATSVCIYFEEYKDKHGGWGLDVGMSSLDMTTGFSMIYEKTSKNTDDTVLTEMFRFVKSQNPVMVLIYCKLKNPASRYTKDFLVHYLELETCDVNVHLTPDSIIPEWTVDHDKNKCKLPGHILEPNWQNQFLGKIFDVPTGKNALEWLGLTSSDTAKISLVCLLHFISEANPDLVQHMSVPEEWRENEHLILTNNTINQLNLTETSYKFKFVDDRYTCPYKSVLQVVNKTNTAMGERYLTNCFLNPIRNVHILKQRYDLTQELVDANNCAYFRGQLRGIGDIERLFRKAALGKIIPRDISQLLDSCMHVQFLWSYIDSSDLVVVKEYLLETVMEREVYNMCKEFTDAITSTFDVSKCTCGLNNMEENIFSSDVIGELDSIQDEIKDAENRINRVIKRLGKVCPKKKFAIKYTKSDGYYIHCATKKTESEALKATLIESGLDGIDVKVQSTSCKIKTDVSRIASDKWTSSVARIKDVSKSVFLGKWAEWYSKYGILWSKCVRFIAELDFYVSNAIVAIENRYVKPVVHRRKSESGAFIKAKAARHPLVEKINNHVEFVPNDIRLGKGKGWCQNGMVIYGVNGTGKSIYLKTIPICLIMAQAGMFVPADKFEFSPFSAIMTRISNSDNLFKGESTFQLEMTELKTIMRCADVNTLVLGDETCSGTERDSALGIVSTSMEYMCRNGINFVFSTHMHEFYSNPRLRELENLVHYHLHVEVTKDGFVYDRKLKPGSGLGRYGIEVARGIGFDIDFIKRCYEFRDMYMGMDNHSVLQGKKSKYNASKLVDMCEICEKRGTRDSPLHTHHLHEQCTADAGGYIGRSHKNELHNLVVLCKSCHEGVHHGKINGLRRIDTSQYGVILDYEK